ncbi:YALIA101S04e16314g1_1 [Yarrowia lipolytica]|jgi:platelet-activating factor acetylhydrolase IB subunit alpha|nr:Nuclear distribution protein PAC1 [Yarrowia lipolytica]SEI34334.1 YALIA101S04e16314g1_1 [Yarrowia lipolytica]VBB89518.1 Nuclear migration protein, putative [Yarrowia lipolytica]
MESLLTDKQRSDLETSIFGYVSRLTNDEALLSQLAAVLSQPSGSESVPADTLKANALLLEKKWLSVIRLQRKVMDLETRLEAAEREASSTHKANGLGAGDPKTWLPKTSRFSLLHKQPVNAVSFHPFHSTLASACEDGNIRIWDYELGEIETTIKAHTRGVLDVDFSQPDTGASRDKSHDKPRADVSHAQPRALLVSCSSDLTIRIWDPQNEYANVKTLTGHDHTISAVKFTASGNHVISASRDKTVRVWSVQSGYCVRTVHGHTDWVKSCAALNEEFIFSAGIDHVTRVSEFVSGDGKMTLLGHEHVIEGVAVYPKSAAGCLAKLDKTSSYFVVSWSRDKTIRVWSSRGDPLLILRGHDNWVRGVVLHPAGRYLVSVSDDKTMRCWDLEQGGRCIRVVDAHGHFVTCVAWAPNDVNGRVRCLVATGGVDGQVKVWQ